MTESLQTETEIYSALAEVYDSLMDDVNYELWADFIDEILMVHHPEPVHLLELACGTGSMALSLEELECYEITATDASESMIRKAREKAKKHHSKISFEVMDFLSIDLDGKFDAVIMAFDSINYLHQKEQILTLMGQVKKVLKPEGIFIFDFTTPRNSVKSIRYLHKEKGSDGSRFRYSRTSRYNHKLKIHTNDFLIKEVDEKNRSKNIFRESHKQKIYTLTQMKEIIGDTDFKILAAYDGFQLKPAKNRSLRITVVLK